MDVPQAMIATPVNQPVDIDGWHHCFGHVGVDSIWTLAKRGLIDGLEVKGVWKSKAYARTVYMGSTPQDLTLASIESKVSQMSMCVYELVGSSYNKVTRGCSVHDAAS